MERLNQDELMVLYFNFTSYRDNVCNGRAKVSVQEFYKKFGLATP